MNPHYQYEHFRLWDKTSWEHRLSSIRGLVCWIGENQVAPPGRCSRQTYGLIPPDPALLPGYNHKTGSADCPEVVRRWKEEGLVYRSLEMGGMRWIAMVPDGAVSHELPPVPVLVVFHHEDYASPYWAMRTLSCHEELCRRAAAENWLLLFIVTNHQPDRDLMYVNILQEALVLFPGDARRVYLDVSALVVKGQSLRDIPDFTYLDPEGRPAGQPDSFITTFGGVSILPIQGRWENRGSLGRDLIMEDRYSSEAFQRERLLRSETGRKLALGMNLEYRFDRIDDPELARYWADMGLAMDIRETKGQRWLAMAPSGANALQGERLPLLCILQEVYPANEHLAVTALSYFYTFCRLAAQGEFIALFFVLEDPDSNDLLEDIILEACRDYPVDSTRVYAAGHSHDARFACEFARRHPLMIAGVARMGLFPGLPSAAVAGNGAYTDQELLELSSMDMPLINLSGCCEHMCNFPVNQAASHMRPGQGVGRPNTAEDRIESWQRRLLACGCPVPSSEKILKAAGSPSYVERKLGFPCDHTELVCLDGFEHYIADIRRKDGSSRLRIVGIENMPHIPTPSMQELAWDYLRRFLRDPETGRIKEHFSTHSGGLLDE